jgi:hypothetical protein
MARKKKAANSDTNEVMIIEYCDATDFQRQSIRRGLPCFCPRIRLSLRCADGDKFVEVIFLLCCRILSACCARANGEQRMDQNNEPLIHWAVS